MCGICGVWYFDPERRVDQPMMQAMAAQLIHRGPDEVGFYDIGSLALAVRRLKIIDGEKSCQPMLSEDGCLALACNGEIYNFRSLRQQLMQHHHFSTEGDVETILHLYEDYGLDCVNHLRGIFAFALWDGHADQLVLAVDRFGKKPLYYFQDDEKIIFASELKAIMRCADLRRELDYEALDDYLSCGYIRAPRSIYVGVHRLAPGQRLTVQRSGSIQFDRYWQPTFAESGQWDQRSPGDLAAELRDLLVEAVRLRMVSDVPLGAFLSGGLDSSAVVALMTQIGGAPVKTFSIGFDHPDYDESTYARAAADFFHADHNAVVVQPDVFDLLPRLVQHYDEPFADSSMIPTYLVSQLARSEVTVVLSGDGGDEVFGGYHQHLYAYRQLYLQTHIPRFLHPTVAQLARRIPRRLKIGPYLAALDQPAERWIGSGFFSTDQRNHLYSREARRAYSERKPISQALRLDELSQVQHRDLTDYLPNDILVKVDRASMLASLEVRCPLLDHVVFEFMARVPPSYRVSLTGGKRLLRQALGSLLPPFVHKRKKQGFSIPQAEWLRGALNPMLRDMLSQSSFPGLFNQIYIRQLVDEHSAGQVDHKDRLWALLCLEVWARERINGSQSLAG